MSTYKRPVLLQKQLQQLLRQEYTNFEIIISDNDTEASAKYIAKSFNDDRIKYFTNDVNLGMVKSFNKSIERSQGNYVVMITDDDPAYTYMLSNLIALTKQYPGFGVYAGCGDLIIENEFSKDTLKKKIGVNSTLLPTLKENEIITIKKNQLPTMYLDGFFSSTYLLWSCCMIEKNIVLDLYGMPDYGSELLTDHAFIIASASKKGMLYVNKSMGGQSIHGDNFGYHFSKIKNKYVNTPNLFYTYLKKHLDNFEDWNVIEKKLWRFVGRGHVEYSLMIFETLKLNKQSKKEFFMAFHQAFANENIIKWKYKFYLKAYCKPLFNLLLKMKKVFNF
jgi:glycosyltransferase involved in cell wall biosynthesis